MTSIDDFENFNFENPDFEKKSDNIVPRLPIYFNHSTFIEVYNTLLFITNELNAYFISNKNVSGEWKNFTYTLVYLNNENRCMVMISIFDCENSSFLLEINRLSGDSLIFINIFKEVKNLFESDKLEIIDYPFFGSDVDKTQLEPLIYNKALEDVLSMAFHKDEFVNVTASKIICSLLLQNDLLDVDWLNIFDALKHLITIKFDYCNEYAWGAIKILSSMKCRKLIISDSELVYSLLELCSNDSYETIPMRRVCSTILSNIICSDDKTCVEMFVLIVHKELMLEWLESVDKLEDQYVREQALHVKNELKSFHGF